MSKQELQALVTDMVRRIKPQIAADPDPDAALTSSPRYFGMVDLFYLYVLISEEFPDIEIPAKDFEDKKFNSISGIVRILSDCGI